MMRAVLCKEPGGPDVLILGEIPQPVPGSEELLIKVHATALNRADLLQRRGKYPPPPGASSILGLEIAGEVVEIGRKVTHFRIGDRVCGLVPGGGYAQYCLIDYQTAFSIPENLSFIEAAAIPEAFLTAQEALFTLGQLQQGEHVLIHAGGSGVGTAAIQLAKYAGSMVYTTVGSEDKLEKVKAMGADVVILYKKQDFTEVIQNGVDVIIDFVGASYLARHLNILSPCGRLICVGLMGGTQAEVDLEKILRKRLQIKGLIMRTRSIDEKRLMAARFIEKQLPPFEARILKPVIDCIFDLNQIEAAHRYMETNKHVGKIVITV